MSARPGGRHDIMRRMGRLEATREAILATVCPLASERVGLHAAAGRWLAEAARAGRDVPAFACSAMDGYAVRSGDTLVASRLRVARAIYAGDDPGDPIASGEAARIFTGAPLPPGADAVVREEAAHESDGSVEVRAAATPGENVRQAGEDVVRGGVALERGTRIGARQLALLTSIGLDALEVVRAPRVALLCTGDELVRGRTPDSNGAAIQAALRGMGLEVRASAVGDDLDAITRAIEEGLASCDAVVTTGGVSIGVRDHVPSAVARLGGDIRVHGVPMKPGKPFLFALARGRPLFGLPGSPSACLVAFEVFARPTLLRLAGSARPLRRAVRLPIAEAVSGRAGRARFLWARIEEDGRVRPIGRDAAQVRGPALADALVLLEEGIGELAEDAPVTTWLLEEDGS